MTGKTGDAAVVGETSRGPRPGQEQAAGESTAPVTQVLPRPPRRASSLPWAQLGGRAFGWLTVLPVLLVVAWLLPSLPLLLAGRFLPVPVILIAAPLAALLVVLAARYLPSRWPSLAGRAGPGSAWAAWWGLAGTVLAAAGFGAWQFALNSPQVIVQRQPGVATQLGYWLARHPGLPIPASAGAFGGSHAALSFASYGFAARGSSLVRWQFPGLPLVLAAGSWLHGLAGLALVSPVLGACAVLAVGGLTGRLAGLAWAPVGALVMALTLPEILTSRSAYSEPLSQLLLIGGLCLAADSLTAGFPGPGRSGAGPARGRPASAGAAILAAPAGLALGLTVLVQPSLLLVLLPVIPFAAALAAEDRLRAASFSMGVIVGIGYGLAGGLLLAAPGTATLAPSLRLIVLAVICTAVLTLVGIGISCRGHARELLARRPWRWLPEAAAVVVVLAAAGFAVRAYVPVTRGGPGGGGYVAALQRLAGLPADRRHLYAEDSFYWVIWYLGLPALLLGVAGLAMIARRCARALLTWRDPGGDARILALPLLIIGWGTATVLWRPGTAADQPWASRTLVPVVLPGLIVCGVWAAAWLGARARERSAGPVTVALAALCFTAALAAPAAVTSLGGARPAVSGRGFTIAGLALNGPAAQRTGAGEAAAVSRLCGTLGRQSAVLILDQTAARQFTPVLRGMCGVPAGVMVGASPGQVLAVARDISRAGWRPVLLTSRQSQLRPYQAARKVLDLTTRQDAHLLTGPPDGTWPARYQVWISVPAAVPGT